MTYAQFLDLIISDGIAEVREAYADPKDRHKRDGAIEGFEACRGKTPDDLVKIWQRFEGIADDFRFASQADPEDDDDEAYWKLRYRALQVEFVCNVVSVGLVNAGQAPLMGHLPTTRGAMKYAEIVGVRGGVS